MREQNRSGLSLDSCPAIRRTLARDDTRYVECVWNIFDQKWIAYIGVHEARIVQVRADEQLAALQKLEKTVAGPDKFYPRDYVIQELLRQNGGAAQFKIPAGLTPDQRTGLVNVLVLEGISTVILGDAVSLSLTTRNADDE